MNGSSQPRPRRSLVVWFVCKILQAGDLNLLLSFNMDSERKNPIVWLTRYFRCWALCTSPYFCHWKTRNFFSWRSRPFFSNVLFGTKWIKWDDYSQVGKGNGEWCLEFEVNSPLGNCFQQWTPFIAHISVFLTCPLISVCWFLWKPTSETRDALRVDVSWSPFVLAIHGHPFDAEAPIYP